jgi:acetylornithine deacetylase/succinyl-diaminopimelate desuccinylase-like protein
VPGASRTILFYCHYDGQPADPAAWTGHDPWDPILRDGPLNAGGRVIEWPAAGPYDNDWRIYARSASDDKAPIVALMAALDGLRAAGIQPGANLKFLFEGDEEIGSPNLPRLAREHGERLGADLVVAADGPIDPSGRPTIFFGVRGIVTVELTVYGPVRPLHSGHYGNWAPNPAMRLAQLLASMKDPETGRVAIEGFYDDVVPLSDFERQAIAEVPDDDEAQRRDFAFGAPEMDGRRLEVINLPSLNVRGLRSAWVGDDARTIVPDRAVASLDLRLVKEIRPEDQIDRLRAHIEARGYHIVEDEPDRATRLRHPRLVRLVASDGYPAFRTSMDLPVSRALIEAVESHTGRSPIKLPTLGGSVPLYVFTDILGVPTVGVPIVNHDNNQHSPDENLRIGHLWAGIETLASVMQVR